MTSTEHPVPNVQLHPAGASCRSQPLTNSSTCVAGFLEPVSNGDSETWWVPANTESRKALQHCLRRYPDLTVDQEARRWLAGAELPSPVGRQTPDAVPLGASEALSPAPSGPRPQVVADLPRKTFAGFLGDLKRAAGWIALLTFLADVALFIAWFFSDCGTGGDCPLGGAEQDNVNVFFYVAVVFVISLAIAVGPWNVIKYAAGGAAGAAVVAGSSPPLFPMDGDTVVGDGGSSTIYRRPDGSIYLLDREGRGGEAPHGTRVLGPAKFDSRNRATGRWAGSRSLPR